MKSKPPILATALLLAAWVTPASPAWAQDSAEGKVRRVNGMQMYYEERGEGSPLLLLHGFFGCGRFWQPFLEGLAVHHRLIIPDLRGHGRSTNPMGRFTHRQSARDVLTLLDQLGIRRVQGIGFSTGGMTLLHMATQQQDRVEAMVLVGATLYFPEQARVGMRSVLTVDSLLPEVSDLARRCAQRGDPQIRELVAQFYGFKDSYDDMNFTQPYLRTITARTLIVHGDRDALFPIDIPVQAYEAIPRSYLWIIPNGSHLPIFEAQGHQFQDLAIAFLRGDWERH